MSNIIEDISGGLILSTEYLTSTLVPVHNGLKVIGGKNVGIRGSYFEIP